ncbi:MAG: SRPBCC family protein [Actinomycetota bacterium]
MEIADSFRVSTAIEDTWRVLLDIERIAPCLPGAQLQEIEGDEYRGIVKVKVGPITAQYKGSAHLTEVDEADRRIVIDAAGRDTRGQGNAKAKIVVTMRPEGAGTAVDIVTDLAITGKVAQFGRGELADVSGKLVGQFVENLERDVLATAGGGDTSHGGGPYEQALEAAVGPLAHPAPDAADGVTSGEAGSAPTSAPAGPGRRRIDAPEPEAVDLLGVAGGSVAKRGAPVAGGVLGLLALLVLWRILRRRR